jgi:hypothetical protein
MAGTNRRQESQAFSQTTAGNGAQPESLKAKYGAVAIPIEAKRIGHPSVRRATGPRTAQGKERSKFNALKHGLFSKVLLLKGESWTGYLSLLNGLRDDLQPHGMSEDLLVENLATSYWHKRRLLQAETAMVSEKMEFLESTFAMNRYAEAWDISRAAIASSGLLKHMNNRLVVREARQTLEILRRKTSALGSADESRLWKKLYGQDHDGGMANGLRMLCESYATIARQPVRSGDENMEAELKRMLVAPLETMIELLTMLEKALETEDRRRLEHMSSAAVIPGPEDSDRLMRCEAHRSREIERILNRLDRLQRIRKGQPVPPEVDVNISA